MSPRPETAGETREFFELHTFHGGYWLCARTASNYPEALNAGEQALAGKVSSGIRIAQCTEYADYDFIGRTILTKKVLPDVAADPSLPLVFPSETGGSLCRTPADLRGDRPRDAVATALQRYFEESRLTPLELLHSDTHALRLNDTGTTLQGALQRAAVAQVQNSDVPVQRRFKELMALADATLAELRAEAQRHPVRPPAPGGYGALCAEIERNFPAEAANFHLFRALAAALAGCKGWLAKLRMLDTLVEDGLTPRRIMPLDALTAEILSAGPAPAELAGPDTDRLAQVRVLLDIHAGRFQPPANAPGSTLPNLNRLIAAGGFPRTQAAIYRRLLRELMNTTPLQANWALWNQAQALHLILNTLKETPPLGTDAELLDALEQRAARAVNSENVRESLATCKQASERVLALVRIANLMPQNINKARMAEFVRAAWSLDDLIREGTGGKGDRTLAVPLLVRMHKEVSQADIDAEMKDKMLTDLDGALTDIVRVDVMNAPNRSSSDRIVQLLKLCAASPLPRCKARGIATEIVGRAVNSSEFIDTFLKRFPDEAARKQGLQTLRKLLIASGLAGR